MKRLGEILIEQGVITPAQLQIALSLQRAGLNKIIGEILIEIGFISPKELAQALAIQAGMPYEDLTLHTPSKEALLQLERSVAESLLVLPLDYENNIITLAIADPFDIRVLDYIHKRFAPNYKLVVSDKETINRYIQIYYSELEEPIEERINKLISSSVLDPNQIPHLLENILNYAIINRTTDIHIVPEVNASHVFLRIDGFLSHFFTLPREIHNPFVSRIKVLANMDIAEQRLPQDGAFSYSFLDEHYDMRVSTLPTPFGESIVLRVLPKKISLFNINNLGFSQDTLEMLKLLLEKPNGIIIVTGPTGSGKTTTLYSLIRQIDFLSKNVVTVEDPIEYRFPFIRQTQVNEKAGYTFFTAVRHFLRHDPDVILVGEIRDKETAQIAIRASITGHLVLTTLHTNNAVSTIARLMDLGVDKYLIATSVRAILAQRLARKVCTFCKKPVKITVDYLISKGFPEELISKYVKDSKEIEIYKGNGCERCKGTGFLGRVAISELLIIDDEIGNMILEGKSGYRLLNKAKEKGMRDLKEDGLVKILNGITTPEEVIRVVG